MAHLPIDPIARGRPLAPAPDERYPQYAVVEMMPVASLAVLEQAFAVVGREDHGGILESIVPAEDVQ